MQLVIFLMFHTCGNLAPHVCIHGPYLMFHTCGARFDVTENLKNFISFFELNKTYECMHAHAYTPSTLR